MSEFRLDVLGGLILVLVLLVAHQAEEDGGEEHEDERLEEGDEQFEEGQGHGEGAGGEGGTKVQSSEVSYSSTGSSEERDKMSFAGDPGGG